MKHIGFDESTVLGEYARIANEKGIVKAAAAPQGLPGIQQAPKSLNQIAKEGADNLTAAVKDLSNRLTSDIKKKRVEGQKTGLTERHVSAIAAAYQKLIQAMRAFQVMKTKDALPSSAGFQKNVDKLLSDVAKLHKEADAIVARIIPKVLQQFYGIDLTNINAAISGIQKSLGQVSTQRQQARSKITEMFDPALMGGQQDVSVQEVGKAIQAPQKADDGISSTAATDSTQKCYDVTGETGEQLIDSAHPGGGTKTELDVKTDENLVETIVEQQKKDIDVANSVPKGTYSMLLRLHDQLAKMGYSNRLSSLKSTILRMTPIETIVRAKLIGLADKLDKMGLEQFADRVDDIKKKAVGEHSDPIYNAQKQIKILERRFQQESAAAGQNALRLLINAASQSQNVAPETVEQLKKLQGQDIITLRQSIQKMQNSLGQEVVGHAWDIIGEELNKIIPIRQQIAQFQKQVEQAQQQKGQSQKTKPEPQKKNVFTDYGLAMRWSKRFNGTISKVDPNSKIDELAQLHVKTGDAEARRNQQVSGALRKSLINAIRVWRKAGKSFKGLEKYLRETYKDQLAKFYPGEGTAATTEALSKEDQINLYRQLFSYVERRFRIDRRSMSTRAVGLLRRVVTPFVKTPEAKKAWESGNQDTIDAWIRDAARQIDGSYIEDLKNL